MEPTFSIILPTYNRSEMVVRAIDSVMIQSYGDFELIVVDDGSTDDTSERIKQYSDPRIKYIWKVNEERSIARNFGIDHAHGKYICFLDADDYLFSNHFMEAVAMIDELRCPEVFHLAYEVRDREKILAAPRFPATINDELIFENRLSCNGVFIRRDITTSFRFIDSKDAVLSEDWFLWLTLAARFPFHCRNVATSVISHHSSRSLYESNAPKVERSINIVLSRLRSDQAVVRRYGARFNYFSAECTSLIALAFSEDRYLKQKSLTYFFRAVLKYPAFLFRKRSFAIIRNFMFGVTEKAMR